MNIHPRLLDGKLTILKPGEYIRITISHENHEHMSLLDSTIEREQREKAAETA